MKNILRSVSCLLVLILSVILLSGFTGNDSKDSKSSSGLLTFTVRTVTQNGTYAPKHVLAIWVEDADGFVKTRKAMANQRKQYLYTWKAASNYNVVDAITGSTLNSHQTHTVSWNCTDLEGNIVPDGDYTIWVEFTEKHAQGPLYSLTFTKGPNTQSIFPADQTYFKDIQLDFVPLIADFYSDTTEICQGETVTFTDQSVGATSWNWNFGEGATPASATSIGPHTVTYNTPGVKTVSLTINNSLTEIKENFLTINPAPIADFSFSGIDYTVDFLNNSIDATSYLWNFGDGITSTDLNPTHTYSGFGTYVVSLTAYYINCTNEIIHNVSLPIVGISEYNLNSFEAVSVSPIPSTGVITIKFNQLVSNQMTLCVYNSVGSLVYKSSYNTLSEKETIKVDLSNYPKGVYFISTESLNYKEHKKIILY
jgi:PKD repeat protein